MRRLNRRRKWTDKTVKNAILYLDICASEPTTITDRMHRGFFAYWSSPEEELAITAMNLAPIPEFNPDTWGLDEVWRLLYAGAAQALREGWLPDD